MAPGCGWRFSGELETADTTGQLIFASTEQCVRASGVAHFAHLIWPTRILLFCSISPVGNLASPAGVEPSDARRAAP